MTPQQIETAARNRHNAATNTFWSQDEIFKIIYEAELDLATRAHVYEVVDTSLSTVISQRAYSFPTGIMGLKRVEINGRKLQPIDFREDDSLTLSNAGNTATGDPLYYAEFADKIYLRPLPAAVQVITLYAYKEPTMLTTASVLLSVPSRYHKGIIDYVIAMMATKDDLSHIYDRYMQQWNNFVEKIAKEIKRGMRKSDAYRVVGDESTQPITLLGPV